MMVMMIEDIDRCSNCDRHIVLPGEVSIMMCGPCLDFLSKIAVGSGSGMFLRCHVCGQLQDIEDFGKVTSVEDCICDFCNGGVEDGQ